MIECIQFEMKFMRKSILLKMIVYTIILYY